MVETESKEEYDELVEEILRRLEENDLYIKLKKYRQKIKKICNKMKVWTDFSRDSGQLY